MDERIDSLAARVTTMETMFAECHTILKAIRDTGDSTHILVNSRMTQLTETMRQLAEVQRQLASVQGEARGIVIGRERAVDDGR